MQCDILGTNRYKSKQYGQQIEQRDSPLQVQLIKFLGLKKYLMDKFIFKRKPSKYQIVRKQQKNYLLHTKLYYPSNKLTAEVQLIQLGAHSIPILYLKHNKGKENSLIIYSHGNSSDLSESIVFLEGLALRYGVDVLSYDYSGYGQSRVSKIGQETIVKDLQLVISWVKVPLNKIILWGFSLGSYPTVCNAAKFKVAGMVLQCPIASINCMFEQNVTTKTKFKQDHFSNFQIINQVKCWTFIVHAIQDEVIPIRHSHLLFQKFSQTNGKDKIWFLQIAQAKHNELHKYFVSKHSNDLKQQFTTFINKIQHESLKNPNKQQSLLRLHNRSLITQVLFQNQQFYEQQSQLLVIHQTNSTVNPGRKFKEKRTLIPRCCD